MNTHEILVTGGTGSRGSRVVNRLSEAGENVRVMSRYWHANTKRGDLLTGERLEEAVEGISTIIHCASSSLRKTRQVDVDGTRRLLQAAERAGVSHVLFISIVGVDRNPYFPYYRMKLETERIIEHSEVPWTILRATQFHGFVLRLIQALDRLPTMVAPRGFLLQPIDVWEVADRTAELALAGPTGRAPDVGGPEIRAFADLASGYSEAAGRKRRVVEVPLLGKVSRALCEGAQTAPDHRCGKIRWEEFLTIHQDQGERDYEGRSFRFLQARRRSRCATSPNPRVSSRTSRPRCQRGSLGAGHRRAGDGRVGNEGHHAAAVAVPTQGGTTSPDALRLPPGVRACPHVRRSGPSRPRHTWWLQQRAKNKGATQDK
jgi:uncharacterized protein YbjT (DUF2867 family)